MTRNGHWDKIFKYPAVYIKSQAYCAHVFMITSYQENTQNYEKITSRETIAARIINGLGFSDRPLSYLKKQAILSQNQTIFEPFYRLD